MKENDDCCIDDRVCMHYIIDQLEEIINDCNPDKGTAKALQKVHKSLYHLKESMIYNLGVNSRLRQL
tara:strand:- start:3215 stop:3415 length:201 start_codon:yes stop_codon:yes gene_type:complete